MFNKKISLILMTLVFMLSVSAVVAADSNSTDDVLAGEVDEEPPSGDVGVLSADESTGGLDDSGNYSVTGSDVSMNGDSSNKLTLSDDQVNDADISQSNGVLSSDDAGQVSLSPVSDSKMSSANGDSSIKTTQPLVTGKDVSKTYKSSTKYTATFLDANGAPLKNTNVKFILNGKTYTKKTDSKGVASLDLDLNVGKYVVYAVHPNGYNISNKIVVKHSIYSKNLNKYYKSGKKFSAIFYGTDGKVLANKYVKFKFRGKTFSVKTYANGKAKLKINSRPGTYKITVINTVTGEKVKNTIKVLPTLHARNVVAFTDKNYKFKVTLYKDEKLSANNKVVLYIKGVKKTAKTDSNGVATFKFKLSKGTYTFKAVDPYTGYGLNKKVTVKLASIKGHNIGAIENQKSSFSVMLYKQNGQIAKKTKMKITINGVSHIVKTTSKGYAHVDFKFPVGKYKVVCEDLDTGYKVTYKITVVKDRMCVSYSKYGVSADGKTILAIGRPSAPGEESKYGYTWYMAEFERTCPYCGSHELYWDVFWSGNEHDEVGIFPATGNREPGSTEGMIFCKNCDADFSVFGLEHIYSNPKKLTVVYGPVKSSKNAAYQLKSGTFVR